MIKTGDWSVDRALTTIIGFPELCKRGHLYCVGCGFVMPNVEYANDPAMQKTVLKMDKYISKKAMRHILILSSTFVEDNYPNPEHDMLLIPRDHDKELMDDLNAQCFYLERVNMRSTFYVKEDIHLLVYPGPHVCQNVAQLRYNTIGQGFELEVLMAGIRDEYNGKRIQYARK